MNRRAFVALLGSAAAAWPLAARTQEPTKMHRIGVIGPRPENAGVGAGYPAMVAELRKLGFNEGRNLIVDYKSNEQERSAIYFDAAELVHLKADVLVAFGTEVTLQAALAASTTLPVVMSAINYDPIARGYVKSLAQPGGRITGFFVRQTELAEKQVELLAQAFPGKSRLAFLWDGSSADQFSAAARVAESLKLQVISHKMDRAPYDFDGAFRSLANTSPDMLLVLSSPYFIGPRRQIARLAIEHHPPAMFIFKLYVDEGGLMSYGVDTVAAFRNVSPFVAKILRGAKPADLPVEQPTRFELVVNLKTAKALGIELPTSILLRADEVIE